jgi:hypothetical protein
MTNIPAIAEIRDDNAGSRTVVRNMAKRMTSGQNQAAMKSVPVIMGA